MNRTIRTSIALASLAAVLAGCRSTYRDQEIVLRRPIELASKELGNGRSDIYKLDMSVDTNDMHLVVQSTTVEEYSSIGLELEEIGKELAQKRFLKPYGGLFVAAVERESAADEAGILPGDMLLSVQGIEVIYLEQVEHLLRRIPPGETVALRIRRPGEEGTEFELELTSTAASSTVESVSSVPLVDAAAEDVFSGLILGTLPAKWSLKVFGDEEPAVLVGGVYLGSPAWHAGMRTGQRIRGIDGRYYQSAEAVRTYLAQRGRERQIVTLDVQDPAGRQREVSVALEEYSSSVDVKVPLIFGLDANHLECDWNLGPLGLLMNYESRYENRDLGERHREYGTRSEFRMLLNLFKWRSSELRGSRLTLLWIISIG